MKYGLRGLDDIRVLVWRAWEFHNDSMGIATAFKRDDMTAVLEE